MARPSPDASRGRGLPSLLAVLVLAFAIGFGAAFAWSIRSTFADEATTVDSVPTATTGALDLPNTEPTIETTTTTITVEATQPPPTTLAPEPTEPETLPTEPPETQPITREPGRPNLTAAGTTLGGLDFEARRASACEGAEDCQDDVTIQGLQWAWTTNGGSVELLDRSGAEGEEIWTPRLGESSDGRVGVLVTDVTGDGQPDFVIGRRTDDVLSVDVVDATSGSATVVLHLDLDAGRVRVSDGRLVALNGVYVGSDPAGEPSRFDQWTLQGAGPGAFVLSDIVEVGAADAPASQL